MEKEENQNQETKPENHSEEVAGSEEISEDSKVNVSDEEMARRKSEWVEPKPHYPRGYGWMYAQHIRQANEGCDFDFLEAGAGDVPEPEIH